MKKKKGIEMAVNYLARKADVCEQCDKLKQSKKLVEEKRRSIDCRCAASSMICWWRDEDEDER